MKQILLAFACAAFALHVHADDWTGHWVMPAPSGQAAPAPGAPGPQPRAISLWLKADGTRLTGYLSARNGDTPISEGKIEGDHLSFVIVMDYFGEERRAIYSGVLASSELRITLPAIGGRAPREVTLTRVSSGDPPPLPPTPPKITLPPAKDVPYNGLAKTPPMGWNSWNKFRNQVSASTGARGRRCHGAEWNEGRRIRIREYR